MNNNINNKKNDEKGKVNEKTSLQTTASASSLASTSTNDVKVQRKLSGNNTIRLPWGIVKEKPSDLNTLNIDLDKCKPGEYLMNLIVLNFIQISSRKLEQIVNNERDRRLKDCLHKNEDQQFDKLISTMGNLAEKCLPSLTRTLLVWYETQVANLNFLKQQSQVDLNQTLSNSKLLSKAKSQQMQAKLENEIIDERRELVVHSLLCISLIEILKQLPFHPGNDEMLNYIIDLSFQKFLAKNLSTASITHHTQLFTDNQYVIDLYAELIGTIAHSRFNLVKRRFLIEFERLKLNISSSSTSTNSQTGSANPLNASSTSMNSNQSLVSQNSSQLVNTGANNSGSFSSSNSSNVNPTTTTTTTTTATTASASSASSTATTNLTTSLSSSTLALNSASNGNMSTNNTNNSFISPTSANIIKLLMGMKYFRIKMVPIEDFEASFQFLNDCAQYFVDVKDKDIKHTLAGLFVEILVPITGIVKNEVNIPCLKSFVDILYNHAMEFSSKSKHRIATFPLLTCLLCVSQKQFFLNNWFPFAQLCLQQLKSKEQTLTRISLEAILRLVWVYMIRIKGEKSNETNQRLLAIVQCLFPKGNKYVNPKEMPVNIFVKIINYIAYEKLDFAMKEIVYELLSIDVNSTNNTIGSELSSSASQSGVSNSNNANSTANNLNSSGLLTSATSGGAALLNSAGQLNTSNVFKTSKDNLLLMPVRMDIGLKAFMQIADTLQQQKESGVAQAPTMPATFNTCTNDSLSFYLSNHLSCGLVKRVTNECSSRVILTDALAREIGLGNYFELVRRSFQDILKTLDCTIGKTHLMTRPDNTQSQLDLFDHAKQAANGSSVLSSSTGMSDSFKTASLQGASNASSNNTSNSITSPNSATGNNEDNKASTSDAHHVASSASYPMNSTLSQMSKDLILNAENKSRLGLLRTCIGLLPRMMPLFKENELIEIVTRLTIHIDDELKIIAFQTLKTLVNDFPHWRKFVFVGFSNFILKEISEMYPKLIENALKMLIQFLHAWKSALDGANADKNVDAEEHCQIIYHMEAFALFNLCHSHVQRRRYALTMLKECKSIGQLVNCFKNYPHHNYALDVLDMAAISVMKHLHIQCFNSSLVLNNVQPDLHHLIELSANWDVTYNHTHNQHGLSSSDSPNAVHNLLNKSTRAASMSMPINESSTTTNEPSELANENDTTQRDVSNQQQNVSQSATSTTTSIYTFDPWNECLAIFFSYEFIFSKCPQVRLHAWPFIYTRLQQLLPFVDPNLQPQESTRASILFGVGANSMEKLRKQANERDVNLSLWKNYLMGACCLTSGSDRYLYYGDYEKPLKRVEPSSSNENEPQSPMTTSQSTGTLSAVSVDFTIYESTSKFYATFGTATSLLKMIVPFIKCECNDFREILIRGLGRINIEAMRELIDELVPYMKECLDKKQDKMRKIKKRELTRIAIVRLFELMAEQRTLGKRIIDTTKKIYQLQHQQHQALQQQHLSDEQQLKKTFNEFVDGIYSYLEQDNNNDKTTYELNAQLRLHFALFLHKLIDSVSKEKRSYLINSSTRYNLFFLCDKWTGGRFVCSSSSSSSSSSSTTQPSAAQSQATVTWSSKQASSSATTPHLYLHQHHYHHHHCYHYYDELELAATRACAALLYCGDTCEMLTSNSKNNTLVFTWLSQLLECANVEMRIYDACKASLSNELYILSLNVLVQLLDLALYNISLNANASTAATTSTTTNTNTANTSVNKANSSNNNISNMATNTSNVNLNQSNSSISAGGGGGGALQERSSLFDWVIEKCFSSISQDIADLCFIALAQVYIDYANSNQVSSVNAKSFESVYLGPLLTLALLNIGSTRLNLHETSIGLLRTIYKNFLVHTASKQRDHEEIGNSSNKTSTLSDQSMSSCKSPLSSFNMNQQQQQPQCVDSFDIINSMVVYTKSQSFLSEYLSKRVPDQTMYVILEITSRLENCASHQVRHSMLTILIPWFYNIRLVDPSAHSESPSALDVSGYEASSEIVLNNLFYLTCKFGEQYANEFERLWTILALTWRANLKVVLRFLYIMMSLATYETMTHVKRVVLYLFKASANRVVAELITELECIESFMSIVEKCENVLPFYRYTKSAPISKSPKSPKRSSIYFINKENDEGDEGDEEGFSDMSDEYEECFENGSSSDDEDSEDEDTNQELNESIDSTSNSNVRHKAKREHCLEPRFQLPLNYESFCCPLNVILYHIGHNHTQHHLNNHMPLFSYHNNCLHHNHYQHIANLSRGNISLVLLSELVSTDGADFDWSHHLPLLFHYCLINFDNTKQLISEHAKKLFLNAIYIVTVQYEFYSLSDYLIEWTNAIMDNQSLIFDRKYTSHNQNNFVNSCLNYQNQSSIKLSAGTCHYNYNYNGSQDVKTRLNSGTYVVIKRTHSTHQAAQHNNSSFISSSTSISMDNDELKHLSRQDKAKEHLSALLEVLLGAKNSPVWPYEFITHENYAKELTSVNLINSFVFNLKSFFAVCFANYSNLDIGKRWAHYALITSLNTTSRHYAGRSLQIYRALGVKLNSCSSLAKLIQRLMDTVADANEDVQGYVTELLLTLKQNAELFSRQYLNNMNTEDEEHDEYNEIGDMKFNNQSMRQKSKSLQTSKERGYQIGKKSATVQATTSTSDHHTSKQAKIELIKNKSATMSRQVANEMMFKKKKCKFRHQIEYNKSLSKSLFNNCKLHLAVKDEKYAKRVFKLSSRDVINTRQENMRVLVQIFWTAMCLLESDFDHEFTLAIEIIEEVLLRLDLFSDVTQQTSGAILSAQHKRELRTNLELFMFKMNWPNFPGLQNLALKGCLSTVNSTNQVSQRLLIHLISLSHTSTLIDPNGANYAGLLGLSMNLIALLPIMIYNYDKPDELSIKAAEKFSQVLKDRAQSIDTQQHKVATSGERRQVSGAFKSNKTEQLKNLALIMDLYSSSSFGKDRVQWTKCVITYLSEFFQLCQVEDEAVASNSLPKFYNNWIIYFTELLDKHATNASFQTCVLLCLNSLLNYIDFDEQSIFINDELVRVLVKYSHTNLWSEVLDLIKLIVSKSSSLTSSNEPSKAFSKKELPGRTLDFNFDFGIFTTQQTTSPNNKAANATPPTQPPLNLLTFHSSKQNQQLNQYILGNQTSSDGWKKPMGSQMRTRDRIRSLLNKLSKYQSTSAVNEPSGNLKKTPSVIFESSLNSSQAQQSPTHQHQLMRTESNLEASLVSSTKSPPIIDDRKLNSSIGNNVNMSNSSTNGSSNNNNNNNNNNSSFTNTSSSSSSNTPLSSSSSSSANTSSTSIVKEKSMKTVNAPVVSTTSHSKSPSIMTHKSRDSIKSLINDDLKSLILANMDDNNFINNTFSFLDDLDSDQFKDAAQLKKVLEKNNVVEEDYENFPWHAILPSTSESQSQMATSNQQLQMSQLKASTLPLDANKLSSNSLYHSISSKSKPMAPRIKIPATIGVASGAEALKTINDRKRSGDLVDRDVEPMENNETQSVRQRANTINKSHQESSSRGGSITRIIRSDSLHNLLSKKYVFNVTSPTKKSDNSNNNQNNNSLSFLLGSNVIYDHVSASPSSENKEKSQEAISKTNSSEDLHSIKNIIKANRNALRISSFNNLTHLMNSGEEIKKSQKMSKSKTSHLIELSSQSYVEPSTSVNEADEADSNHTAKVYAEKANRSMTLPNKIYDSTLSTKSLNNLSTSQSWFNMNKVKAGDDDEPQTKQHDAIKELSVEAENIDELWKAHFSNVFISEEVNLVDTFHLFNRLFKETCRKLNILLLDCRHYLSLNSKFFIQIERHLVNVLDLINNKSGYPVVYVNSDVKLSSFTVDKHKRIVWEIGENYDTLVYLRQAVLKSLEAVKKQEKSNVNTRSNATNSLEKKVDLCKKCCKLLSQFMLLLQSSSKLLPNLVSGVRNLPISDKSNELKEIRSSLKEAFVQHENLDRHPASSSSYNLRSKSKESLVKNILELVNKEDYLSAVGQFKSMRKFWPSDFTSFQTDFDIILLWLCEQKSQEFSNLVVIIEADNDLNETIEDILIENIEIANKINLIDRKLSQASNVEQTESNKIESKRVDI